MIPSLYFDYLRQGDARPLARVFYHNAVDILSMAALLGHITKRLADPTADPEIDALDLLDMGRLFEDLGRVERAAELYRHALTQGLPVEARRQAVRRWSFLEKRRENLSVAAKLWQDAAQAGQIYAHVELAKMYEHREQDYARAIYWTEAALEQIGTPGYPRYERLRWADELAHRLERLHRRQAGEKLCDSDPDP
jgi:TPR repeat protein